MLKYRLPGSEIVSRSGDFQKFRDGIPYGFVVSNFEGTTLYEFKEGESIALPKLSEPFVMSRSAYLEAASELIEKLKRSGGKTVFSRIQKEVFTSNPEAFFHALCATYPKAFVYLIASKEFGVWIGATPETLMCREEDVVTSMALAGTRKATGDTDWTKKEFEEHEFVADYIEGKVKAFEPFDLRRSQRRESVSGPVKHLRTDFQWEISKQKDWDLAKSLHPTPAVSGWPVNLALEQIRAFEKHDRGLYTGIIGLIGDQTNLFVNLRCAQIIDRSIFLYLGGGFTQDSEAEEEWKETENKAATLYNVLKKH